MEERLPYLSNMSAPPKTVVSYSGLAATLSLKTCKAYWAQGKSVEGSIGQAALFGMAVRVVLPPEFVGKKPITILRRLGVKPSGDHEAQLIALINARAEELPLPDGCVVIRRTEAEREIWKDALTALAILTKCSDVIWLRDKHPALQAAFERGAAATLLVPPGFVARLPEVSSPPRHREEVNGWQPTKRSLRGREIASGPAETKGPSQ